MLNPIGQHRCSQERQLLDADLLNKLNRRFY